METERREEKKKGKMKQMKERKIVSHILCSTAFCFLGL